MTSRARVREPGLLVSSLLISLGALTAAPEMALAQAVQGCQPNQYVDRSAPGAVRTLTWDFGIENEPEHCMQVAVGQTVTFDGDLENHPLGGSGGDTPNPIALHADGSVTFTAVGTFGYECLSHSSMVGAIKVVPAAAAPVPALPPWLGAFAVLLMLSMGLIAVRHHRSDPARVS